MGFKGQIFLQTMKAGSTVMAVRQLRYFELQGGKAIPYADFSDCLQAMVDRHILGADQPNYLPISTKQPPSIIGDLLTYFISYNVIDSGAREARLHNFRTGAVTGVGFQELNGKYSKFFTPEQDQIILDRMYEDDRWELKLRKTYGLTEGEATSDHRFRIAAARVLHQNFGASFSHPEWQRGRLVSKEDLEDKVAAWTAANSLAACGPTAVWWWTAHGPGLQCWIGFHASGRQSKGKGDSRTYYSCGRLSTHFTEPAGPPCDDCVSKGLPQCFIRYSEAVKRGFIERELGRSLCLRLIAILSTRITNVLERKPELATAELNVLCDWAEQLDLELKLESWEEDEDHLIKS